MKFIDRQDGDLAFMLKFENIAWYEEGKVSILDRRIYPLEVSYVTCTSYKEVAKAIADMVTQSEGPYVTAAMGMALAMFEAKDFPTEKAVLYMEEAAYSLSHARPTTFSQMSGIVSGALKIAKHGLIEECPGEELVERLHYYAYTYVNENYKRYDTIGRKLAKLIPDNGTVMTQCFAGTVVGTMLRECKRTGKKIHLICPETRPYFQGARLTASVACDMGFDVTVITDNMPAYMMSKKRPDLFTSASDVITMDGHVVNKVGTFQIALAAKYYGIPYYVTGTPDPTHNDLTSVVIEERDPEQVLHSLGKKTVMDGVKGYYPAFDVTPPELVTGIITEKGIYKAKELMNYFKVE